MKKITILLVLFISIISFGQTQNKSIGFIENKGQIVDQKGRKNNTVKYLLNTPGLNVQLRKNGFSYDVYETKKHPIKNKIQHAYQLPAAVLSKYPDFDLEYIYHRIDIDFENSNPNVELISEEKSTDYDNYYNVPSEPNGVLDVHKYQKITYQNIYQNIDVVFFIPQDKSKPVEYNFIVKPSGKISDIQLKFKGVKTELVDNKIKMNVRFGAMEETLPLSWTENNNLKNEVSVNYKKIKNNVYGFSSVENLADKTVIIDPVPIRLWGSYFYRYIVSEDVLKIKTDTNDNVFFIGTASIYNYNIATTGVFISSIPSNENHSFLTKFNSAGQRLWTTFIANGVNSAIANDLALNNDTNEIYVVGKTFAGQGNNTSNLIATPGAHKQNCSDFYSDGFILKFNNTGQRIWGTFFGGENREAINSVSLDNLGNVIIGGYTASTNEISTPNSYLPNSPSSNPNFYGAGFFAKFSPNGNQLYGSFFNGSISFSNIDSDDNIYFAGQYNEASGYPTISTPNAHQITCNNTDTYIIKFNSSFQRQWCTYYGGTEYTSSFGNSDRCSGIETDNNNNLYLFGTTSSPNNIATPGSFKDQMTPGNVNGFITKFNSQGNRLWGTYYGSNITLTEDTCESGTVNRMNGDIFIMGNTRSSNYFSTSGAFQQINNGSDECYVSKFNTSGNLLWSTFYGTQSQDYASNIYFNNNFLYAGGFSTGVATNGNDLGTPGAFMPNGGGYLYFLAKFQDCLSAPQATSNTPTCIGSTLNLTASGGTSYSWSGPNGFTSNLQNPTIANVSAVNAGEYNCIITGTGGCDGNNSVNVIIGDIIKPIPNVTSLPTINGDCNTIVATIPTATDICAGTINGTTTNPLNYSLPGNYTINWSYDDGNGNIETQTQNVIIVAVALPVSNSNQTFCIQQNSTLNSIIITGQNIKWYDAPSGGNLLSNTTSLVSGTTYYASQTINTCESLRIPVAILIQTTLAPIATLTQTFCTSQIPTLSSITVNGTAIIWYNSSTNSNPLSNTTQLIDGATYYASQTINNCESINRLGVTVDLITTLNATNYSAFLCDDLNNENEIINLSNYNSNLISNTTNCTFEYYSSSNGANNQISSDLITNFSNYNLAIGNQIIYVRITSSNGCNQIVELNLSLFQKPIISINDVLPICKTRSIIVDAGTGFNSYSWSTGSTNQFITITTPATYFVTVTKNYGTLVCSSTKTFTVIESEIATITSIETEDWTDVENVIVIATSNNDSYLYSLDGVNYQASNTFSGLMSGFYTVYVKNECGIIMENVVLLNYPKFFTPNDDGFNDFWKIKFSQIEPNLTITIFDRYGKIIKALTSNDSGWDGTYNGEKMPSDDYWFVVTRQDGKQHKGHFALKR